MTDYINVLIWQNTVPQTGGLTKKYNVSHDSGRLDIQDEGACGVTLFLGVSPCLVHGQLLLKS